MTDNGTPHVDTLPAGTAIMTPVQVARLLGVARSSVDRLLPGYLTGEGTGSRRHLRYRRADVMALKRQRDEDARNVDREAEALAREALARESLDVRARRAWAAVSPDLDHDPVPRGSAFQRVEARLDEFGKRLAHLTEATTRTIEATNRIAVIVQVIAGELGVDLIEPTE